MRYLIETRHRIFIKGFVFLSFAKNMGKDVGKNVSRSLDGKYSQQLLAHAQRKADSKRTIQSSRSNW